MAVILNLIHQLTSRCQAVCAPAHRQHDQRQSLPIPIPTLNPTGNHGIALTPGTVTDKKRTADWVRVYGEVGRPERINALVTTIVTQIGRERPFCKQDKDVIYRAAADESTISKLQNYLLDEEPLAQSLSGRMLAIYGLNDASRDLAVILKRCLSAVGDLNDGTFLDTTLSAETKALLKKHLESVARDTAFNNNKSALCIAWGNHPFIKSLLGL